MFDRSLYVVRIIIIIVISIVAVVVVVAINRKKCECIGLWEIPRDVVRFVQSLQVSRIYIFK